jgi:hypothetical protein
MFRRCAGLYQLLLHQSQSLNNYTIDLIRYFGQGDFLFRAHDQHIVGYVFYVFSGWKASFNYYQMARHNKAFMDFLEKHVTQGPQGVQSGFVAYQDWFWFYDLQLALTSVTVSSILL